MRKMDDAQTKEDQGAVASPRKLKKISVVSIFYNEEENARFLYERVSKVLDAYGEIHALVSEFVFVENGSVDRTFPLLMEIANSDARVKVIKLSRNFGQQNGYTAGIEAVSSDADALVLIDGDVQDPPEMIPDFIRKWEDGFDVVYGIRKRRKGNPFKILCYRLYYRILRTFTGNEFKLPMDAGEFGLMDAKVWKQIAQFPESNRLIRGLRAWVGFKQTGIEYTRDARQFGEPKFTLIKMFSLALDGICSLSGKPLRIVLMTGTGLCSLGILSALYLIVEKVAGIGQVAGYALTNVVILMVGGVQLLCLGIVGEYIKRIYDEAKGRPKYIVETVFKQS